MNKFYKLAFTLAEVLIVIGILGIVASVTIPNLADSYEEEKTVLQISKAYNELDTAYQKALVKYGDYESWPKSSNIAAERITEFLQGRICGVDGSSTSSCFPSIGTPDSTAYKMELQDGTMLAFYQNDETSNNLITYAATGINSKSKGRNLFAFNIYLGNGVYPAGYNSDRSTSTNNYTAGSSSYNTTNWVIHKKNLDFLNCPNSLNWKTKSSCK